VYGPKTWDAVKGFKAKERLGFETMGDVGPGTMRRLNELFPAAARPIPMPRPPSRSAPTRSPARPTTTWSPRSPPPACRRSRPSSLRRTGPRTAEARSAPAARARVSIDEAVDRFELAARQQRLHPGLQRGVRGRGDRVELGEVHPARDPKVRPFHQVVGTYDFVSDFRPLKPNEPKGLEPFPACRVAGRPRRRLG
jgi:hypothetical protein